MSTEAVPDTVAAYLQQVPGDRGEALRRVFETVRQAMPEGYELGDFRGAPLWTIPLSTFPTTYNGDPLSYVGLIAQKNYNSLYLMGLYSNPDADAEFRAEWAATGLRLNMGKSCLRFRTLGDVDLGIIGRTVAAVPVERYLEEYSRIKGGR